jgi:hypothetical protein
MNFTQLLHDSTTQLFFVVALVCILADFVAGTVRAFVQHTFKTTELADFLHSNVLPYVSLLATTVAVPVLTGVPYAVAAGGAKAAVVAFCLAQVASASENLAGIIGFPYTTFESMILHAIGSVFPSVKPVLPNEPPVAAK